MIHALPGMGADHRMYPAPWPTLPDFSAHDWIRHHGERSIAEVAKSMCELHDIRDGAAIVGSSLGGMVGCEITKIRRIPRLYLIGSAVHPDEVNELLAKLHPLARVTPVDWLRFSAGKIPHEMAQMFTGMEKTFMRAMVEAIFDWKGLGPVTDRTRVFRIHGRRDRVILPPAEMDLAVDGGHLISMTHVAECVDFIRAQEAAAAKPAGVPAP